MPNRTVGALGTLARGARLAGVGVVVNAARDAADSLLARRSLPPLSAESDGLVLRGFLRHRSVLAEFGRGTPGGYRKLLERVVSPGSVVVDAGAHIGVYTLVAARALGGTGVVYSLEPDPYNFAALQANTQTAGRNVHLLRQALSDRQGIAIFHPSRGTISGSLLARDVADEAAVEVETTSIDALLADAPLESLTIKLNIEGAERRAVEGATETIERAAATRLFVETNPATFDAAGEDPAALFARLRELGFSLSYIDPSDESLAPFTEETVARKGHVFCERVS